MNENFISINLIDRDKVLTNYPLIYFWNGNGELEDAFKTDQFKNYISKIIDKENYWYIKVYLIYVYQDKESENQYINKEYQLLDILPINDNLLKEYVIEVLDYLYYCAFKLHLDELDISGAYNAIRNKYPKKITTEVVSNYIKSQINERYPEIPEDIIDKIEKIFLENINNDL